MFATHIPLGLFKNKAPQSRITYIQLCCPRDEFSAESSRENSLNPCSNASTGNESIMGSSFCQLVVAGILQIEGQRQTKYGLFFLILIEFY